MSFDWNEIISKPYPYRPARWNEHLDRNKTLLTQMGSENMMEWHRWCAQRVLGRLSTDQQRNLEKRISTSGTEMYCDVASDVAFFQVELDGGFADDYLLEMIEYAEKKYLRE